MSEEATRMIMSYTIGVTAGNLAVLFVLWMLDIRRRRREYREFEARLDRHDAERERWWADWQVKLDEAIVRAKRETKR